MAYDIKQENFTHPVEKEKIMMKFPYYTPKLQTTESLQ